MASPLFPVNTHRHDPYRTFKFQVVMDNGQTIAGAIGGTDAKWPRPGEYYTIMYFGKFS